jgi:hypothetical protein
MKYDENSLVLIALLLDRRPRILQNQPLGAISEAGEARWAPELVPARPVR